MIRNFDDAKPQISQDVLKSIEDFLCVNLPIGYRNYILEVNGGIARKNIFLFPGTLDGSCTHHWYGIRSDPNFSLLRNMRHGGGSFPERFIAVCDDSFGNLILLSVKGHDYGKVYFWDHERETEPADYSNLTLIANSFEEFINNLKSEEEMEELEKAQQ